MAYFQEAMGRASEACLNRLKDRSQARMELYPDDFLWGQVEGFRQAAEWAEQEMRQEDTEAEYLAKTSQVSDTTPGTGANHQEEA